jgi:DNA repair photolyase
MGPVLPFLTDSPAQLDATVRLIAEAGAASVTPIVLHLRPGAREWFLLWLSENFPDLVDSYRDLYGHGAYAPRAYQDRIAGQVRELAERYGVGRASPRRARSIAPRSPQLPGPRSLRARRDTPGAPPAPEPRGPVQLSLL